MAQRLSYSPKVGEILYCHYGSHTSYMQNQFSFDFNLPNEMVKSRMVLCLNGKLSEPLVVPISTTPPDQNSRKYCILTKKSHFFQKAMMDIHGFYNKSYVKCHMIQNVSKYRLSAFNNKGYQSGKQTFLLERDFVLECQKHVALAVNMDRKLFMD